MTKIIGVCMLSLTVIVWGSDRAILLKKKTRRIGDYLDLLRFIRAQIDCFARPIGDILLSYPGQDRFASAENGTGQTYDLNGIISTDAYLFEDANELLSAFAENIGSGTRDESVRLCDFTIAELEALDRKYREEYPGKARLWRTLPCLACLSLLILLL